VVLIGLAVSAIDTSLGEAIAVLGICLPLLAIQDLGRYLGFATQRPSSALVLDATWLLLLVVAVVPLFVTGTHSLPWLIAAWGGSGAAAGLLVFVQHGARTVRLGLSWLRYTWSFSWRYLISYVSTQSGALGAASSVGAIAGARALGGLQGALLLVRPFTTFQIAVTAASIGHVTRSLEAGGNIIRRYIGKVSVLTTCAAAVNLVVMVVLPDGVGRAILGDSWEVAQPLLFATGVQILFLGLLTGPRAGLLGMRAIRKVMAIDIVTTGLVFAASIVGAEINGALGAIWAVTVVQAAMTAVMWTTFLAASPGGDIGAAIAAEPLPPEPAPTPPAI
jgi:O-antigen/teichoic acid export membrane protein